VRELVEYLTKSLVDEPDEVSVEEVDAGRVTVYEVTVAEDDVGKIIGRSGRTVNAVRAVVRAAAVRDGRRVLVDVVD
jgi:predicted RNA-binding protein YlqC (UPF0109 family)